MEHVLTMANLKLLPSYLRSALHVLHSATPVQICTQRYERISVTVAFMHLHAYWCFQILQHTHVHSYSLKFTQCRQLNTSPHCSGFQKSTLIRIEPHSSL